jgi:hypothetical protein
MSSAFYPQGMQSYNNNVNTGGYKTWKGSGVFSNPVGIAAGNMRPLTNKDPANDAIYAPGRARPIRHYRIGRAIRIPVLREDPNNPGAIIETDYYSNREVKSSTPGKLIGLLIDRPGEFIVKPNIPQDPGNFNVERAFDTEYNKIGNDCKTCTGIGIVSDWMPINDLTDKPEPITQTPFFCCNAEQKALKRVLPANTVLKKNYYTTSYQYLYNRCQTFEQREFNFLTGVRDINGFDNPLIDVAVVDKIKPGAALSEGNLYVANCNPNGEILRATEISILNRLVTLLRENGTFTDANVRDYQLANVTSFSEFGQFLNTKLTDDNKLKAIELSDAFLSSPLVSAAIGSPANRRGCKVVYYKPNNAQFAQQGAVSSSTRTLKANVVTIEKNIAEYRRAAGFAANVAVKSPAAAAAMVPFIYKIKTEKCNPGYYTKNGNPKTCFRGSNDRTIAGLSDFNPISG